MSNLAEVAFRCGILATNRVMAGQGVVALNSPISTKAVDRGSWRRSLHASPEALYLLPKLRVPHAQARVKQGLEATVASSAGLKALQHSCKGSHDVPIPAELGTTASHRANRRQAFEEGVCSFRIIRSDPANRVDEFVDPLALFRLESGGMLVEVLREEHLKLCGIVGGRALPDQS
jgi:hypothetical protein